MLTYHFSWSSSLEKTTYIGDVADAIVDLGVASDEQVEDWKLFYQKK